MSEVTVTTGSVATASNALQELTDVLVGLPEQLARRLVPQLRRLGESVSRFFAGRPHAARHLPVGTGTGRGAV